jgi:hypothetical protein
MKFRRELLIVPFLIMGCNDPKQWAPPANSDFIDLSEGEIPEFKAAVDEARESVDKLKTLIERHSNSNIQVLVFFAEEGSPRYVWAELDQGMLGSIDYPFKLTEAHPKWKTIRVGQQVAMTNIALIYDWKATVDGQQQGNYTTSILARMNRYYP